MNPPPGPLQGNNGEWSEAYTWCRLLAQGSLALADANLNSIPGRSQVVNGVRRREATGIIEHRIVAGGVFSRDVATGRDFAQVKQTDLRNAADAILDAVLNGVGRQAGNGGAYGIPAVEPLLRAHGFQALGAASLDKADIQVLRSDPRAPVASPDGYSIKSRLGKPSTLLNPGKKTNFRFQVAGTISAAEVRRINAITTTPQVRNRILALEQAGGALVFDRVRGPIFQLNLEVIDSRLPELVGHALLAYYRNGVGTIADAARVLRQTNPMGFNLQEGHPFYEYKLKRLLQDVALGMRPESTIWDGVYDATAGYIVVRDDGQLVAFNLYNLNDFQDYLAANTRFDMPSTTRFDYGYLGQELGRTYIDLCLQIRFIR